MKKKELLITCECQGEILSLQKYEDEVETYLTVYRYYSIDISFFARLKMCWKVLKGEGISTADLVLSEENFEKIKQF